MKAAIVFVLIALVCCNEMVVEEPKVKEEEIDDLQAWIGALGELFNSEIIKPLLEEVKNDEIVVDYLKSNGIELEDLDEYLQSWKVIMGNFGNIVNQANDFWGKVTPFVEPVTNIIDSWKSGNIGGIITSFGDVLNNLNGLFGRK